MEVTFLSSTGSFGGVGYNLSKVYSNTAQVLEVANFDGLKYISSVPTINDYVEYLKLWSERNSRIRNTQFHVAISCKGHEKSKEELLAVAKQWLKEMGYEGIPALFVFHKDTNNNHIHIVTSRVDPLGRKVKDSNERWRGRSVLKKIEGINIGQKDYQKAVKEALSYRFSNVSQFALLLEQRKYKITEVENGDLLISKYGKPVTTVSKDEITRAIEEGGNRADNDSRKKQIKALLIKYKENLSITELKDLMKRTFGIDIVLFGKKNSPYGYALIDHKDKVVYKGSEILPLKELLRQDKNNREKKIDNRFDKGCSIIDAVLKENRFASIYEVRATLRTYGYFIRDYRLYHYGKDLGMLKEDVVAQLDYNKRLGKAQKVNTDNPRTLDALARHYIVHRDDLHISQEPRLDNNKGYHSLQELYDSAFLSGDLFSYLKLNNAYLFTDEGKTYIIDKDLGAISEIDTTNPERALVVDTEPSQMEDNSPSVGFEDIADIFIGKGEGSAGGNNEVKKRRRR